MTTSASSSTRTLRPGAKAHSLLPRGEGMIQNAGGTQQAEACVACISSCSRDLDISDGCVDIRSFSVDVFTDKLVEGVGALNTLCGRVKSRRSVNTVLHGKYCLIVFW